MTLRRLSVLSLLYLCLGAPDVLAQSEGRAAIGASFAGKVAAEDGVHGRQGVALLWRFGHGHEGWGFRYGLGWYSADLDTFTEDNRYALGKVRIRPLVAGYGYSRVVRGVLLSGNLQAGYAFNSWSMTPAGAAAYRDRFGGPVDVDASNTFVVRPEVSAWIDLSPKVGLNLSTGYTVARPELTITGGGHEERHHVRADMYQLKIGLVYSVF